MFSALVPVVETPGPQNTLVSKLFFVLVLPNDVEVILSDVFTKMLLRYSQVSADPPPPFELAKVMFVELPLYCESFVLSRMLL